MSTDKHLEFGSQTSNISSANHSAYGRVLMADTASTGSTSSSNHSDNGTQMTDPDDDQTPVWQLAGKALIVLLVIFGLVLGGRWVWSNYSSEDNETTETTETTEQVPLPVNDTTAGEAAPGPEPVPVDGDIPALGPANPVVMTIGAAILAATLYRFSNLAHQPNRGR